MNKHNQKSLQCRIPMSKLNKPQENQCFLNDLYKKEHDNYIMHSILHSSNLQRAGSWYSRNRHEQNFNSSLHDYKFQTKRIYIHEKNPTNYRRHISNPRILYEEESNVPNISLYTCKRTIASQTVLFLVNESF